MRMPARRETSGPMLNVMFIMDSHQECEDVCNASCLAVPVSKDQEQSTDHDCPHTSPDRHVHPFLVRYRQHQWPDLGLMRFLRVREAAVHQRQDAANHQYDSQYLYRIHVSSFGGKSPTLLPR